MDHTQGRDDRFFSKNVPHTLPGEQEWDAVVILSMLFSLIALLSAPWLVILGLLAALVMGYRFAVDKNGPGFEQSFDDVVKNAACTSGMPWDAVTEQS
jgi:hypothetical protein